MTTSVWRRLPHPTDSERTDRFLVNALLLWLVYFGSLRVTRSLLAAGLTGDAFGELPPNWYFVPVAIGHAVSLGVGWLALSRENARSPLALIKSDWSRARQALVRIRVADKGIFALLFFLCTGVTLWTTVMLVANLMPRTAATTMFHTAAHGSLPARALVAFLATCTAPVIEELFYRGYLLTQLRIASGRLFAVLLVTVLFAAAHSGQYSDASGRISWPSVISVGLSGLAFALLRLGTGSLAPGVIAHAVLNGINTVIFGLLLRQNG